MSNLKQKGRRLELMHKIEDSIIDKINEQMMEKSDERLEEEGTGYIQGQG